MSKFNPGDICRLRVGYGIHVTVVGPYQNDLVQVKRNEFYFIVSQHMLQLVKSADNPVHDPIGTVRKEYGDIWVKMDDQHWFHVGEDGVKLNDQIHGVAIGKVPGT